VVAALKTGVSTYWRDPKPHGKLGPARDKFRAAFIETAHAEIDSEDIDNTEESSFRGAQKIWVKLEGVVTSCMEALE